mgnify:CR=1 FL=1
MKTAYKLQGIHRHYDWGGTQFIPQLMHFKNDQNKPFAEYWMGWHLQRATSKPRSVYLQHCSYLLR